jgi:hypothetical protein
MTAAIALRTFPAVSLSIPRPRPDLWRDAFLALGAAVGIAQANGLSPVIDSGIYWRAAGRLDALYPTTYVSGDPAFVYPPPLVEILAPFHALGLGAFLVAWEIALFAALWYCAGRWSWAFAAVAVPALVLPLGDAGTVLGYAMNGNVQLLLAASIAVTVRHPGAWAAPLLTKPTMGVGILWHVFRREWRAAAVALGVTAAIAAVSFVLAPNLWFEFVAFSLRNSDMRSAIPVVPVALPVRIAMSVALLAWGARYNKRWTVAFAAAWAIPLLYVGSYLAIWVAALRMRGS